MPLPVPTAFRSAQSPTTAMPYDILLIDDTPDNIRFLSAILQEQGYSVRKAITGQMALTAAQALPPDLILLDINLPDLKGYQVCQQLKANEATAAVPVIFLSALDDTRDKVQAFEVGGADYITKPFQVAEVLARINNQLTIRTLQQEREAQNDRLKQALADLHRTQSQLVQKEKMAGLGQIVAGVAHEINNPISFISGNLKPAHQYVDDLLALIELYGQEYPEPTDAIAALAEEIDLDFLHQDLKNLMTSMQSGADRIQAVILALRVFSRLGEADLKPVDLHECLDSTLLLLHHQLSGQQRGWPIAVHQTYGDLPEVTCFASQLNQVFWHLITHAITGLETRFASWQPTDQGDAPTIWIETRANAEGVTLQIRDNGAEQSPQADQRLSDPLLGPTVTDSGAWVGLATAYQIVVEMHKGQLVRRQADAGPGTQFEIKLPLQVSAKSSVEG
jgi:signal transduction histidine kinase